MLRVATVAALLFVTTLASFAREEVAIKTENVTESIFMLQGQGGNLGVLVGDDGVLVIDSDYIGVAPAQLAAIEALGKGKPVFLVNTHFHADHAGGNKLFGETAWIVAHDNVRVRLLAGKSPAELDVAERRALPTLTFDDSAAVHLNGEEVYIKHYPVGHTDGDSVIFFKNANVAHLGDHFFVARFPFIDLAGGGSVQGYLKNLRALLDELPDDVKLIPGHGPLSTKEDLRNAEKLISDSMEIIQGYIDAGKSLDEATEAGLPAEFDAYEWQFISKARWIGIVYKSLTEK